MITISQIAHALSPSTKLYEKLSYLQLSLFFNIISRFMPLILTSAPRATRGLPALPLDMEHVLSMKLRLTTEDVNILWSALGDRLVADFTSSHSSDKLDVDRELSITGPSFHLGKFGVLLQAENSVMLKTYCRMVGLGHRCRNSRPSCSTMRRSWMSSTLQALGWKSGLLSRHSIYTPTWSLEDTDPYIVLSRCVFYERHSSVF